MSALDVDQVLGLSSARNCGDAPTPSQAARRASSGGSGPPSEVGTSNMPSKRVLPDLTKLNESALVPSSSRLDQPLKYASPERGQTVKRLRTLYQITLLPHFFGTCHCKFPSRPVYSP